MQCPVNNQTVFGTRFRGLRADTTRPNLLRLTVQRFTDSRFAIARSDIPSAVATTIPHRSAIRCGVRCAATYCPGFLPIRHRW